MGYKIERKFVGFAGAQWEPSKTYPGVYSAEEAEGIVEFEQKHKGIQYRAVGDVVVYVVDMRDAEKRVLMGSIADGDVQRLLPFQTSLGAGKTYVHIVNESAYVITTNHHEIHEGDTICARAAGADWQLDQRYTVPTCPGCLAKAKRVIVDHLLGD